MKLHLLKNFKIRLFGLILISIFMTSLVLVSSTSYTLNSYQGVAPTIDGIIDANEEIGTGKPTKITLPHDPWDQYGEPRDMDIEIGSSYSNDSYLYINAVVDFKNIISGNVTFTFNYNFTLGHFDMKRVSSITNSSEDGWRSNAASLWNFYNDQDLGGTQDSEGKCHITDKSITFELRMPFNSGDSSGYDEEFTIGEEMVIQVALSITYQKTQEETMYGNYWISSCSFRIRDTTADPIPLAGIVLGIVVICVNVIRKRGKKYRKKKSFLQ